MSNITVLQDGESQKNLGSAIHSFEPNFEGGVV